VISITDGQIYLETDLFNAGIRPAINAGISVSRVGGNAQLKAMKKVTSMLRLDFAQYRELETFAKFGTELDEETRKQLARGDRTVEILKQGQYVPMEAEEQILIIFALINGYLDNIETKNISKFEGEYLDFIRTDRPEVIEELKSKKDINQDLEEQIRQALDRFIEKFSAGRDLSGHG